MALFEKQKQFLADFQTQRWRYMLYGGAVSGGKSILCIGILDQMAWDYPGTKYAIVRKNLKTLKRTSIPSYKKILETNGEINSIKINYSDYIARYQNGSEINFVEADIAKDPDFDKLKGLELTGALIEEANEVHESAFNVLRTRVGRWNNDKYNIRQFIMLNCNPAKNWVKTMFYDPWSEGRIEAPYYYLPALPGDNPHNTKDYLEGLDSLPEAEKQRYKYGNWEYADDPNQLVHYIWIKDNKHSDKWEIRSRDDLVNLSMGCDVADVGKDKSTISIMKGSKQVYLESFDVDTNQFAEIIAQKIEEYRIKPSLVGIDCDGLGVGTYNDLRAKGYSVYAYRGSAPPDQTKGKETFLSYKNKRAQAHWEYREDLKNNEIIILDRKNLIQESTTIKYKAEDKAIIIQPKAELKNEISRSPDELDATVINNYMRKNANISYSDIASLMDDASETMLSDLGGDI